MNLTKLMCLIMAMLLAFGAMALGETTEAVEAEAAESAEVETAEDAPADLQALLDEANARIAALEAEIELYKPYYDKQIVAEYGEGGIIWLEDAQKEYEGAASAYAQYGLNIDDYAGAIKEQILQTLVQSAVVDGKAAELGLADIDEETRANLEAEAAENYETYIESYKSYFAEEGASDEEAREQTIAAMEQYGLTQDALTQQLIDSYLDEQLHTYITKDVTVSDEEVRAKYDALVEEGEAAYADDDYSYNNARNDGETVIAWNPEGYRAVKHVLIKFNDDQSSRYSELHGTLDSLNDELEAATAPAEAEAEDAEAEAEDAEAEAEGDAEEEIEPEGDAEEEIEPEGDAEEEEAPARPVEEIQADIGRVAAEIEALYSELLPDAQKVIDEFNGGADFDSLIEQYNADPGMKNEPTATNGYAVSANSTTWDTAFTEGAMSIESVGQISAPIYGNNGIHIIYYLSDITPGPVPFEDIEEAVRATALEEKTTQTYDDQVAQWVEEAAPVYHLDRF